MRTDHATAGYDHGEVATTNQISFAPGTYPLRVRADIYGAATESNETNNVLQQGTLTVTVTFVVGILIEF